MKLLAGSFAALFLSLGLAADCTFTQPKSCSQFRPPVHRFWAARSARPRDVQQLRSQRRQPHAFPEPPVYLADRDSGNDRLERDDRRAT